MKNKKFIFFLLLLFASNLIWGQKTTEDSWKKISEDECVSIYYNTKTETDKKGNHIVWVKAVYHTIDWQTYFANQIGLRTPVVMTKTKAMYDPIYSYVLVRQVICYNKSGKILFDSGDDYSGGWGLVNASDPVGLVGEYLCEKREETHKIQETKIESEKADVDDRIYEIVEKNASFPNGDAELFKYLSQNMRYPAAAKEEGVQGRVIANIVVEIDGSISDVKIVRSPDPLFSEESLRLIKSMPKWIPAEQNGRPVRSRYTIPIMFKL